jgi:hypothetical protein
MVRHAAQPDLLEWEPPQTVARFAEDQVRAASLAGRVSRAVAAALTDAAERRETIAARMSAFLGERVSPAMLDAYASQAREDHRISVPRFAALLHATRDRRLLELLAEPMGWAMIERRHLPLIEVAAIREHEDELRRRREHLMRQARTGGGL